MHKFVYILIFSFISLPFITGQETSEEKATRMEWFKDAKLGIFIHYGIYAVNGIDESWSFFNRYISYEDYMNQLEGFTASDYDPERWAEMFHEAGARYAVMTTKHHDGVALWDGDFDHYNVAEDTPAGRDLVGPFVDAMREEGLKAGLYYSLIDWSHPDYPAFTREEVRYEDAPERWSNFVDFYFGQMEELSERYDPDLYWFDGDWEHSAKEWRAAKLRKKLLNLNPDVIINERLKGYGDYTTPEQGVPVNVPESPYWELCMTMNDSWGYQHNDHHYKTPYQLLWTFVDCISKGGNLLLDVGPMEDGNIPKPQVEILEAFARWTGKHSEAIYGTRKGLPEGLFWGPSALSKDRQTLYLFLDHRPHESVQVRGLDVNVENVRVVGMDQDIEYDLKRGTGLLTFNVSKDVYDPDITVLAVDLEEPLKLKQPAQKPTEALLARLKDNARWAEKHLPLMDEPGPGISTLHYAGPSLLSENQDVLYLMVDGKPNGPLVLKGLKNEINRIWVVGNGTKLSHKVFGELYWSDVPGIAYIDVPDRVLDPEVTVVAVLLDGPVSLYSEEGQVIESN
ncbi:MAG: alpha-L-fucosidase [Bacteroidota bacterium]